jgi:mRNA-degrading endonuclease YafQ of YafQ-DinJ toxin-antitoxin module
MRVIRRTAQFKQDVRRMEKQGKNTDLLEAVLLPLATGETLAPHYHDRPLVGNIAAHASAIWSLIGC